MSSIRALDADMWRPSFSSASPLRIVLADDHAIVRQGLKSLVDAQHDMRVVGEATNGAAAVRIVCELAPQVLVMDLSMPLLGGAEVTMRVRAECPTTRVVALTVHEERAYLAQLLRAGASGYVLKRSATDQLLHAIRAVAAGGTFVDAALSATLVQGYLEPRGAGAALRPILSEREREVLVRIARGYSNKEIATELRLSVKTIETYKARFVGKLGIRTRAEIARYASDHRLLGHVSGDEAP